MRGTLRLLAKVQPVKVLEANAPTGLTGLLTHPHPRPALIYTYQKILSKLKSIPESSVYRQSTEATTRSRLKIIEATKPAGYDAWATRVKAEIEKNPDAYKHVRTEDGGLSFSQLDSDLQTDVEIWDGKPRVAFPEGAYSQAAADIKARAVQLDEKEVEVVQGPQPRDLEHEPALDADQVAEIEDKIGAGLIEEILQVAEGELGLVDEMIASRIWEPLEEKAPPGQWRTLREVLIQELHRYSMAV